VREEWPGRSVGEVTLASIARLAVEGEGRKVAFMGERGLPLNALVTSRMLESGMDNAPRRLQAPVRKVLSELTAKALLTLGDKRLEVRVVSAAYHYSVWAYFPIWPRWSRAAQELAASGITFNPMTAGQAMLDTHAVRICGTAKAARQADIYERVRIVRELLPKIETRILLVFGASGFEKERSEDFQDILRHHLGHVLLFLRDPKAWNDCDAACKEWEVRASAAMSKPVGHPQCTRHHRRLPRMETCHLNCNAK
jgi:hypothetical protein